MANKEHINPMFTNIGTSPILINPTPYGDNRSQYDQVSTTALEEQRGQRQGFWDSAANITGRLIGRAGLSTLETAGMIGYGIPKALVTGNMNALFDNEVTDGFKKLDNVLRESTPFYQTKAEEKASLFSSEYLTSTNFWGNLIGEGGGFVLGAMGGGALIGKGIGLAGRAARAMGMIAADGTKIAETADAIKKGEDAVDKVTKLARGLGIKNSASFYAQKIGGNLYEAGVEARAIKETILQNKMEEFKRNNPPGAVPDDLTKKTWEDIANTYSNAGFGLNMALLMIDGLNMGRFLKGYKESNRAINTLREAGKYVEKDKYGKIWDRLTPLGGALAEAGQEAGQFMTEKTTTDLAKKDRGNGQKEFNEYFLSAMKGFEETLGSKEGQESMLAGFLLSAPFSAVQSYKEAGFDREGITTLNNFVSKESFQKRLELAHDNYMNGVGDEAELFAANASKILYENNRTDGFLKFLNNRNSFGRIDDVFDDISQYRTMPLEAFKQEFGEDYTEEKRQRKLNDLEKFTLDFKKTYEDMHSGFTNHPYKNTMVSETMRIKGYNDRINQLKGKLADPNLPAESPIRAEMALDLAMLEQYKKDASDRLANYLQEVDPTVQEATDTNEPPPPPPPGGNNEGGDPLAGIKGRKEVVSLFEKFDASQDPIERINHAHNIGNTSRLYPGTINAEETEKLKAFNKELDDNGYKVEGRELINQDYVEGDDIQVVGSKDAPNYFEGGHDIITRVEAPRISKDGQIVQPAKVQIWKGVSPEDYERITNRTSNKKKVEKKKRNVTEGQKIKVLHEGAEKYGIVEGFIPDPNDETDELIVVKLDTNSLKITISRNDVIPIDTNTVETVQPLEDREYSENDLSIFTEDEPRTKNTPGKSFVRENGQWALWNTLDFRNHTTNLLGTRPPSKEQMDDVSNMNTILLNTPEAIEGFKFRAVKNKDRPGRQLIATDPNGKDYDAGYLLDLSQAKIPGGESTLLEFFQKYVYELKAKAAIDAKGKEQLRLLERAAKIEKLYTEIQKIVTSEEDVIDVTDFTDINSRIYKNIPLDPDRTTIDQYNKTKYSPISFTEILNSPFADRWKVNGEFLVVTKTTDGTYRKLVGLKNPSSRTILDENLKKMPIDAIDTQFAILVRRPGRRDNYQFIGLKGSDLTKDVKKAFLQEIKRVEKLNSPEAIRNLVDRLNNEIFIKSTKTAKDTEGNTIPLHLKFAHRGGREIIIFAEPKQIEGVKDKTLPEGFSFTMSVEEAINNFGAERLNMSQNVLSSFMDLSDKLTTNASPRLWKTYLTFNGLEIPETTELDNTVPPVTNQPPPGDGTTPPPTGRTRRTPGNRGRQPGKGEDDFKRIRETVPTEVITQLNEIAKRIKQILNVEVDFLASLENGENLEKNLYGMFRKNVIYLNSKGFPKGTEWHEAFHGVFSILSKEEQNRVLSIARRTFPVTQAEIDELRGFYLNIGQNFLASGNAKKAQFYADLAANEGFLYSKLLEEKVADHFQEYMNGQPVTFFQKFFDKLKKLVNMLLGIVDTDEFAALFDNIRGGKYRYMTPTGEIASAALIPGGATVTETDRLLRTLTNAYMNREEIEELRRYNLEDEIDSYRSPVGFRNFVTEELKRFRERISAAVTDRWDNKITQIEESGISETEKEEQIELEEDMFAMSNYWNEDTNQWVPNYLDPNNDEVIINMVIQHAKFRKIDVEASNPEDGVDRDFDSSEMEKSPQSTKAALAVKDTMASLYYLQDNEVIPINYIEAFNNLLMNLSGRKDIKATLDKLSDNTTEFGKTMQAIKNKYESKEGSLFRTQMRVAFDRSFRKAVNILVDRKTIKSKNFVKDANFNDHIQRQVEIWKAEVLSKVFINKTADLSSDDIYKALGIRLEQRTYTDPEAALAIEGVQTFIGTISSEKTLKSNAFTTALENLAEINIRYRLDLGELNFKNAENKPMHSIMQNNYLFNILDKEGIDHAVFTGAEQNGNRTDYKGITPKEYFMSVLAMYMNNEDVKGVKSTKRYYTIQQFEAKNTVPVVVGEDYSAYEITDALFKKKIENEIARQKGIFEKNLIELFETESPIDLIAGYHTYTKDELEAAGKKFKELFDKDFTNSKEDVISLLQAADEGKIERKYLPRGFRFWNLPYANDVKDYKFIEKAFSKFFELEKEAINDMMREFDISEEEIMNTFDVGYTEVTNKETGKVIKKLDRASMDKFYRDLILNNYLNKMEVLAKVSPDLNQFKDFTDITKRGAGLLASGPNHGDGDFLFAVVPDSKLEFAVGDKTLKAEEVDAQGAENPYERLNRYIRQGLAVESSRSNNPKADEAYQRYLIMKAFAEDDRVFIENEKLNEDAVLKVDKTVGYGEDYYIKTSVHVLTRYFSSIPASEGEYVIRVVYDKNGEMVLDEKGVPETITYYAQKDRNGKYYLPMPGKEYEWNLLNQMSINRGTEGAPRYVEAIFAQSAIKKNVRSIAQGENDSLELRPLTFKYEDYRIQQENPSGKVKIKDGVQLIQFIDAGLPKGFKGRIEVSDKLIAQIKAFNTKLYAKDREIVINGELFNPFVEYLQSTLQSSANNERLIEFFEKEGNGFKYSTSLPVIKAKFESLLMSYFNSNIASHKTAGGKYTLISAKYYKVMVYEDPVRGDRVINNREYYQIMAKAQEEGITPVIKTRNLNFTKQDNPMSEVVLTEEYLDNLGITIDEWNRLKLSEDPEEQRLFDKISTFVGYRIPTQGQQSMMPARIIDFLPRHHGSSVIAPAELTKISGADYDVDSMFAHLYATYKDADGKLKLFTKNNREAFRKSMVKNSYIKAIAEQIENPERDKYLFLKKEYKQFIRNFYKELKSDYFRDMPTKAIKEKKEAEREDIITKIDDLKQDIEILDKRIVALEEAAAMQVVDYINQNDTDGKISDTFILEANLNELLDERVAVLTSPEGIDLLNTPAEDLLKEFYENVIGDKFKKSSKLLVYSSLANQLNEYVKVSTGTAAVGGAANIAKTTAFLIKNGINIKSSIKSNLSSIYKNVDFRTDINDEFDIILTKDKKGNLVLSKETERKSKLNSTSSNTSSAVDNAKDQTLRKFFINGKNITHASTLAALGFGINRTGMLLVTPANKYLSGYLESNASFDKRESTVIEEFLKMAFPGVKDIAIQDKDLVKSLENFDRLDEIMQNIALRVSSAKRQNKFGEVAKYINSLSNEDKILLQAQKAVVRLMSDVAKVTDDMFQINTILNFNKEIGEGFSDIEKLENCFKRINDSSFSFDSQLILKNPGVRQVRQSATALKEYVSTKVISQSKNAKKAISSLAESIVPSENEYAMILYKNKMADAWIEYLGIKGLARYEGIVRKITPEIIKVNEEESFEETFSITDEEIINGNKVIAEYNRVLEYMVELPDSFKLGKLFQETKGNRTYPFNRLIIDTFQNLNTEDRKSLVDGFDELLLNPITRPLCKYLVTHVAAHDNFRYISGSISDKMRARYFNSINKIYSGDTANGLIGLEQLFKLDSKTFKREFKNYFGVSVDESLADFGQFFFSDNRNAANLLDINAEQTAFVYTHTIQTKKGLEDVDDNFDFTEAKLLSDGTLILPQPKDLQNFKLKYIPKYFTSNGVPYRYAGFDESQNIHVYFPVDTSLNTEGVKISLYQFDFPKAVSLIKGRLEEIGEETEQARIALSQESEMLKAGAIGTIVIDLIDEWVQRGKATTTVRSDKNHNEFYRGDGLYVSRGRGTLVNIQYLGKIQLVNDKIIGEGIDMDLDEFAQKEGWSSWEAFTKGLPGEPPGKWAGQSLARGKVVNYYSITPANIGETTGFEEFDKLPSVSEKPTMFYAGIGSRMGEDRMKNLPEGEKARIEGIMERLARTFERLGFTLRSGGAKGADLAFERGTSKKQIFIAGIDPGITEIKVAQAIHPNWQGMLQATIKSAEKAGRNPDDAVKYAISAMARNTNQIFGKDLNIPVDFVVCWTPDGAETTAQRSAKTGGTGQAIDMADRKGIPVFNLLNPGAEERVIAYAQALAEIHKQGGVVTDSIDNLLNNTSEENQENLTTKTITYTPIGKTEQTYTIVGSKVFNKDGKEVFAGEGKDRNRIFANLAVKEGRAVVVEWKDKKYVVNRKGQIVSVTTGDIMKWGEENGDRKGVIALANEKFVSKGQTIESTTPVVSAIQKFLDEQFENYLPQIQKIRGYKNIETKEDFLALPQEKQDSLIKKLCKS
jgi:hypothetical protein